MQQSKHRECNLLPTTAKTHITYPRDDRVLLAMASMESNFPTLKAYARLNVGIFSPRGSFPWLASSLLTTNEQSMDKNEQTSFFDVKFYPYTAPGLDPVFAIVGMAEVSPSIGLRDNESYADRKEDYCLQTSQRGR